MNQKKNPPDQKTICLYLWVGFAVWVLVYLCISFLDVPTKAKEIVRGIAYMGPALMALVGSTAASRRVANPERRLWSALSLAILMWILGDIYIGYQQVIMDATRITRPSAVDVFYLAAYVWLFVMLGVVAVNYSEFESTKGIAKIRYMAVWLSLLTVGVLLVWFMVLAPVYRSYFNVQTVGRDFAIVYPVLDIAIIIGILTKAFEFKISRLEKWQKAFVAGVVFFVAADLLYNFFAVSGSYEISNVSANLLYSFWLYGYFMIFVASIYRITSYDTNRVESKDKIINQSD